MSAFHCLHCGKEIVRNDEKIKSGYDKSLHKWLHAESRKPGCEPVFAYPKEEKR